MATARAFATGGQEVPVDWMASREGNGPGNGGRARSGANRQVRVPRQPGGTPFDRFAESSSKFVSKGLFFTISVVVVAIWMPTIFVFDSIDTWQLVINTRRRCSRSC